MIAQQNNLYAFLDGEIDHHTAAEMRSVIDDALVQGVPKELVLDFTGVTFMDSSGIGLVMGRCKLMNELGGTVTVKNPPNYIRKVMRLSGIDRIATISGSKEGACHK